MEDEMDIFDVVEEVRQEWRIKKSELEALEQEVSEKESDLRERYDLLEKKNLRSAAFVEIEDKVKGWQDQKKKADEAQFGCDSLESEITKLRADLSSLKKDRQLLEEQEQRLREKIASVSREHSESIENLRSHLQQDKENREANLSDEVRRLKESNEDLKRSLKNLKASNKSAEALSSNATNRGSSTAITKTYQDVCQWFSSNVLSRT
eukprot:TRINITY_DN14548_c0_g1_i1.p1 TRINITY_DN14548_c0_g1~~TRINITY_DN14548_c0_g1_i1.p1  ORF type:complete len:220 (-),score=46.13 TRINITY_DN14548_c0_g1_i1:75-698(-)